MSRADTRLVERSLDALDDVFYVYDADARLVHWNQRLNDLMGMDDDELRGMSPEEFFLPEDHERVRAAVAEAFETGETVVEARVDTGDGPVCLQLTGRLLTDGEDVLGFAGVGRDVTEHNEHAWRLETQNERLEEFASIVSHDLRNPLTVAMGRLALAREEGSDAEDHLPAVERSLERIERIVEDVLTAARDGTTVTDPEEIDLGTHARHAWSTVDTGAATLETPDGVSVLADPQRLRRVFENLFRNSVEHGDAGTVRVVATESGFAVEDDGVGIPPETQDTVFDPGISSNGGTGFGLHIVRSLAEAHGWTVTLEEGDGARFVFDTRPVG